MYSVRSNGGLSPADLVEDTVLTKLPFSHSHKCSLFCMHEIGKKIATSPHIEKLQTESILDQLPKGPVCRI